ncbi:MAG: ABC transporter permease [Planctomycetota bacterium]
MATLLHYLRVYRQFLGNSVAMDMSFRVNFMLIFLVEVIWLLVLVAGNEVIFSHTATFGPWSKQEYLMFAILVALNDQVFVSFFAPNFWGLSETLREGTMDFILLKPLNAMFIVFSRIQRVSSMVAASLSLVWLVMVAHDMETPWDFSRWVSLGVLFVLGMCLRLGIEIIVGSFMFITIEGEAVNVFRLNLQLFAKNPDFIYGTGARFLLTRIVPLCLVTTAPIQWITSGEPWWTSAFWLGGLCLPVWLVAILAWRTGLSRYESASS